MRKITCFLFLLCLAYFPAKIMAQEKSMLTVKNCRFSILENTTISVIGNVKVLENSANDDNIHNEGIMIITDSLFNNVDSLFLTSSVPGKDNQSSKPVIEPMGTIIFKDTSQNNISGEPSIYMSNLKVKKGNLDLGTDVLVFGEIELDEGDINLNNNNIILYNNDENVNLRTGRIKGGTENNIHKIYDNKRGAVKALKFYNPSSGNDPANLGIHFAPYTTTGEIYVSRYHYADPHVTEGSIKKIFRIENSSGAMGDKRDLQINFFPSDLYGDLTNNDSSLRIFHKDLNSSNYRYLGGNFENANSVKVKDINFNEGYYTIADSACKVLPAINLGENRVVCEGNAIKLVADTVYTEEQKPLMSYLWSSKELLLENTESARQNISLDTVQKYLGNTVSISLMVMDERGCMNYDTIQYYLAPTPDLGIKRNRASINICVKDTVLFMDTINHTGTYEWEFLPEALADNSHAPMHIFEEDGVHFTNLHYTDTLGCSADTSILLKVHPLPEPYFITDSKNCLGQELVLDNQSNLNTSNIAGSIAKYEWDMGNGNHIKISQDTVMSDSVQVFYSDKLKNNGGIPGPDLSYYYNTTGNYTISLKAESFNGCMADTSFTVNVYDSVHAAIDTIQYTHICTGAEIPFFPGKATTDTSLIAEYKWIFTDTVLTANHYHDTIYHAFDNAGMQNIQFAVVSKMGCTDTASYQAEVLTAPKAVFTAQPVCMGSATLFNTTGSSITTSDYTWEMENKNLSSNPGSPFEYIFNNAGKHKVSLTISNQNACSITFTDSIEVLANPDIQLTVKNTCINAQQNEFILENNSVNSNVSYHWDFGDGYTSDMEQPQKQYNSPGSYTIKLMAGKEYILDDKTISCKTSVTDTIEIYDIIHANFEINQYNNVCEGNLSVFTLSDLSNSSVYQYTKWYFENDTIKSLDLNPVEHTFSTDGTFPVKAVTFTNKGCTDTTTKELIIHHTPDVAVVTDSVCLGNELQFSIPVNMRNPANQYKWYINDQYINTGWFASASKDVAGTYTVVVKAESPNACINADTSTALVYALPPDMFQEKISVCSDNIQLKGISTGYSYLWNNSSTGNTYTVSNNQVCNVWITDEETLCQREENIEIKLNAPLEVSLGNDTSVCGSIRLDAGYYGQNTTYNWSTGSNERYIEVTETGKYKLSVNQGGCLVTDSIMITVHTAPVVDLGNNIQACAMDTITLDAQIANGLNYQWSNGQTSASIHLSSQIPQSAQYRVTVTDINNCTATDKVQVEFNPVPLVNLGLDKETCQNQSIAINALTPGATSYLWNTGESNPVIHPEINNASPVEQTYRVTVKNNAGCHSTDSIKINFLPVPQITLDNEYTACGNEEITISASTPGAVSYLWNNGATGPELTINPQTGNEGIYYVKVENQYHCVATSNQARVQFKNAPQPVLPQHIKGCNAISLDAGNYGANFLWNDNITTQQREIYQSGTYSVTITNGNNCSITDTVQAEINYVEKPYLGEDITLCANSQRVLRTGIHSPGYSFVWNGYSTGDTMLIATPGTYRVKAIHANGCEEADTILVTGRPLPEVNLGPDMFKCFHEQIILDAGDDGFAYYWQNSRGENYNKRLYEVSDTGKYWVKVTNDYSCSNSDTIMIKPTDASIEPLFITNSKLVAGDSVLFVDMSFPEPVSWLWDFGDLQQSVLQDPVHVYYGGGDYTVTLNVSNMVCSATMVKIIEVQRKDKSKKENEEIIPEGDKFIQIQEVKIFPNPNNGNFTIEAELSTISNAHIYIFDLMGRLISVNKYSNVDALNQFVNIQNKSAGIYIIKIIAGTDHKTYKIIKQ